MKEPVSVETLRERERELQFSKIRKGRNTFINEILKGHTQI